MACRTCPQSGWPPLPPGCGRPTPAWTPSPPISSSCGHPAVAGRPRDMADRSTVRSAGHPQFKVTAQPMGLDPVRTAAVKRRTPSAPSVRPCVWPAGHGQPCGLLILAMTGQDGNAHVPFGQPQPRRNVRQPGPRPMSARSCPASTMDAMIGQVPDTHARSYPAGHRRLQLARQPDRKRCGQGNGRTAREAFGHPRSPRPQRRPAGTRRALSCGAGVAACNQDRLGDGNTASATVTTAATRQLLGVAPRSKPRLGALFSILALSWPNLS
jgi:hypothetical protein